MIAISLLICLSCLSLASANVDLFLKHEIVPDVLSTPPEGVLNVTFPNGIEAQFGNELSISQVAAEPTLEWELSHDRYYTLVFCDPDAPSRVNPEARSFLHWLVVNIPGGDVTSGVTLSSILNSNPEPTTGLYRYLVLVYEQPGELEFEEENNHGLDRFGFSPEAFSIKYNLEKAIAGNFYQTENLEE